MHMQSQTGFSSLGLSSALLEAVRAEGYETPTPIQALAIPLVLEGRDVQASAKTGTGKTAAFALPIIHRLAERGERAQAGRPLVLVLVPTRELAAQVGESFKAYGSRTEVRSAVAFGGVGKAPQAAALSGGIEVLVATPGRLLDLVSDGTADLGAVEVFVLDEADRMLDMGFLPDMKRVFKLLPEKRQTLLFSATLGGEVTDIAAGLLTSPESIAADPPASPADGVDQRVYYVEKERKRALLVRLLAEGDVDRALVFTRTRHLANRLSRHLSAAGFPSEALHSDKSQAHRLRVLSAFKEGKLRVLVATDLAARGLDIDELPHVVNMDVPNESETYVHRIGRTARAGSAGTAISFCCPEERDLMLDIERLLGKKVPEMPVPEGLPFPPPREDARASEGSGRRETPPREAEKAEEGGGAQTDPPREGKGEGQERKREGRSGRRRNKKAKGEQRPDAGPGLATGPVSGPGPRLPAPEARDRPRPTERAFEKPQDRNADRQRGNQDRPARGSPQGDRRGSDRMRQAPQNQNQGQNQRGSYGRRQDQSPKGGRQEPRKPLSDEEAWLRAQRDSNQPGIRPPEDR
jgi:ATP-dependent RNA helicase RhlE